MFMKEFVLLSCGERQFGEGGMIFLRNMGDKNADADADADADEDEDADMDKVSNFGEEGRCIELGTPI